MWPAIVMGFLVAQEEVQQPQPTPQPEQERGKIVITGNPVRPTDWFVSPFNTTVIEGDSVHDRQAARSFPDALKEAPGVHVQKTGPGQASPFIRGFTGYRTLALIDGVRLNNSAFRSGPNQYWSTIDMFLVDRIEVVRGPGSVLYGSDAMGGIAAVYSRSRTTFEPGRRSIASRRREAALRLRRTVTTWFSI